MKNVSNRLDASGVKNLLGKGREGPITLMRELFQAELVVRTGSCVPTQFYDRTAGESQPLGERGIKRESKSRHQDIRYALRRTRDGDAGFGRSHPGDIRQHAKRGMRWDVHKWSRARPLVYR